MAAKADTAITPAIKDKSARSGLKVFRHSASLSRIAMVHGRDFGPAAHSGKDPKALFIGT